MLTSSFKVKNVFALTTRNLIVLSGNILSGEVESGMFLVSEENDIRIKINSIESIRSSNASIALTITTIGEHELKRLKELEGYVVTVTH